MITKNNILYPNLDETQLDNKVSIQTVQRKNMVLDLHDFPHPNLLRFDDIPTPVKKGKINTRFIKEHSIHSLKPCFIKKGR